MKKSPICFLVALSTSSLVNAAFEFTPVVGQTPSENFTFTVEPTQDNGHYAGMTANATVNVSGFWQTQNNNNRLHFTTQSSASQIIIDVAFNELLGTTGADDSVTRVGTSGSSLLDWTFGGSSSNLSPDATVSAGFFLSGDTTVPFNGVSTGVTDGTILTGNANVSTSFVSHTDPFTGLSADNWSLFDIDPTVAPNLGAFHRSVTSGNETELIYGSVRYVIEDTTPIPAGTVFRLSFDGTRLNEPLVVPEPSSAVLAALAGLAGLAFRRRR